jgi:hypothetical protein
MGSKKQKVEVSVNKGAEWALEDIPNIIYVCSLFSLIQTFKASANPKLKLWRLAISLV